MLSVNAFMTAAPCRFHQVGTRREPGGEPEEPSSDHRALLPGHRWLLQRVPATAAQRLPLSLPGTLRPHLPFSLPLPESPMPRPPPPSCSLSLSAPLCVCVTFQAPAFSTVKTSQCFSNRCSLQRHQPTALLNFSTFFFLLFLFCKKHQNLYVVFVSFFRLFIPAYTELWRYLITQASGFVACADMLVY